MLYASFLLFLTHVHSSNKPFFFSPSSPSYPPSSVSRALIVFPGSRFHWPSSWPTKWLFLFTTCITIWPLNLKRMTYHVAFLDNKLPKCTLIGFMFQLNYPLFPPNWANGFCFNSLTPFLLLLLLALHLNSAPEITEGVFKLKPSTTDSISKFDTSHISHSNLITPLAVSLMVLLIIVLTGWLVCSKESVYTSRATARNSVNGKSIDVAFKV